MYPLIMLRHCVLPEGRLTKLGQPTAVYCSAPHFVSFLFHCCVLFSPLFCIISFPRRIKTLHPTQMQQKLASCLGPCFASFLSFSTTDQHLTPHAGAREAGQAALADAAAVGTTRHLCVCRGFNWGPRRTQEWAPCHGWPAC